MKVDELRLRAQSCHVKGWGIRTRICPVHEPYKASSVQNEVSRTDVLMGENKLGELERGKVLWCMIVFFTDVQFVVEPALKFGHVLERTSTVVRKETTATWSPADWTWL